MTLLRTPHGTGNLLRRWAAVAALALLPLATAHAATINRFSGAGFANQTASQASATWRYAPGAPRSFENKNMKPTMTTPIAGTSWNNFMANARAMAEPAELAKSIATGRGLGLPLAMAGTALALLADTACVQVAGGTLTEGAAWNECRFRTDTTVLYAAGNNGLANPQTEYFFSKAEAAQAWVNIPRGACGNGAQPARSIHTVEPLVMKTAYCDGSGQYEYSSGAYWSKQHNTVVRDGWQASDTGRVTARLQELIEDFCEANDPKCAETMKTIIDAGLEVEVGNPVIEGPTSTPPQTTQQQTTRQQTNPDGSTTTLTITTTTTTTHNYTYEGDKVTRNETRTVTTVTHNPTTGETTTTTETTGAPAKPPTQEEKTPEQKEEERCPPGSDLAACSKLDTPNVEMPKKDVNITWEPMNLGFGAGACPPPITFTVTGGTYSVPYTSLCNILSTYVKPLLLMMAALGAIFIVMPRET